jgi:hypothetical protein
LADQNIIQGENLNSEIFWNGDTIEADDLKNDSYFDIENMPVIIDNFTTDEIPLSNFLASTSEKCEPSKSIYVIPSTSTRNYMNSILTWPKTLERKGKKQIARLPFVLTSSTRKKAEAEKEEKKKREESVKQRRKTERIRTQQKKQQEQQNKLKDKLEKR